MSVSVSVSVSVSGEQLQLAFDGWQGSLDTLHSAARARRFDLTTMPISAVVDQILAFGSLSTALEVAADHLVMAAWLAYLKSAHLLPAEPQDEEDAAASDAARTEAAQRLVAVRMAADALCAAPRLGRDVFARGAPDGLRRATVQPLQPVLSTLLRAYADVLRRGAELYRPGQRRVVTLEAASGHMAAQLAPEWKPLPELLIAIPSAALGRSALASGFAAGLELVKRGRAEVKQSAVFAAVSLRVA